MENFIEIQFTSDFVNSEAMYSCSFLFPGAFERENF